MKTLLVCNNFPWGLNEHFLFEELSAKTISGRYADDFFSFSVKCAGQKRELDPPIINIEDSPKLRISDLRCILWIPIFFKYYLKTLDRREIFTWRIKSILKTLLYVNRLGNVVQENGIRRIFTYWFNEKTNAAVILKRAKIISQVYTRAHGYDLYIERLDRGEFPFRYDVITDIDKVFVLSLAAFKYINNLYGSKNVVIAPIGVQVNHSIPSSTVDDKTCHMITCAFESPIKRVDLIRECILKAALDYPNTAFKWTYVGAQSPLEFLKESKKMANAIGVKNLIFDIFGYSPNNEIQEIFNRHKYTVAVLLSKSEGLPVFLLEAMSRGIPVLSNDVGAIGELTKNGGGTCMSFGTEKQGFSGALLKFIEDPDYLLGDQAREKILNEFNVEKTSKLLFDEMGIE